MSRRSAAASLWDLVAAIDAIAGFVRDRTLDVYLGDAMLRSAVERQLITIGEVFMRMDAGTAERLGAPVRGIVGMRNQLVHGYDRIDDSVVYDTVNRDLAPLRAAASRELETLGDEM